MANKRFSEEYETVREALRDCTFPKDSQGIISDLKLVCPPDGPNAAAATALARLRDKCERGFFQRLFGTSQNKEANGILQIAGGNPGQDRKAAALKALRHLYLMKRFGGHSLWVMSLPDVFCKWPSDQIAGKTGDALNAILKDSSGRFTSKQMRDLTHASQCAGAWANKASAICAKTSGVGAETRDRLIERWFADETTKEDEFDGIAAKLKEGYKKISVAALSKKLVLTDNPIDRGTDDENCNAYVWGDALYVIYIENEFFSGGGDPLTGLTNWSRILVHELSHSQLDTDDHAYRWAGLKPKSTSFTAAQALDNADSWAFFAADANGKLTQSDRNYCLK